jgi:hypothetical protein
VSAVVRRELRGIGIMQMLIGIVDSYSSTVTVLP